MTREKKNSQSVTCSSVSVKEQYTRESLTRRLKKHGIGYFLDGNTDVTSEEKTIIQEILEGQSLETYFHKIT